MESAIDGTQLAAIVAAIVTGCGVIGGAVKWGIGRVVKSNDAGTAALIANTASNAVLMVKIDALCASNAALVAEIGKLSDFIDEHTPLNQMAPLQPKRRPQTPARGQYHVRGPTNRGEDK